MLRESPWYQEGLEQGILKGHREDILNLLRVRFELAVEDETEIADRLEQVQSTELLQTLVVAAAQVESLATFKGVLDDKEIPASSLS